MAALALLALLPLFWLSPAPAPAQDAGGPRVAAFSPQGTVKGVRQVTARFSEPMVPLGDPREARDPFEVSCPEPGTARWADSRHTSGPPIVSSSRRRVPDVTRSRWSTDRTGRSTA
jgi:hypothetical protein